MTDETLEADALTPEEQAYIDNQGVVPDNEETPAVEEAGAEENAENSEASAQEEGDTTQNDDGEEPKKSDTVPHGAFHAKNEELKRTRAELQELKTQMAVANDRFERFEQMQAQRAQETAKDDDPRPDDDDLIGKLEWLERQLTKVQEGTQQQQQRDIQTQQIQDFKKSISWEEQQYMQEVSDYSDASEHVSQIIVNNLAARGFRGPTLQKKYEAELLTIALDAKEAGMSVPEVIYQMAQNWGYSKKADPDPAQDAGANKTAEQLKEDLEKVSAGQKANKDVSNPGSGSGGRMTLEKFASMSEAESFAWMEKNPGGYEKLLRG